MDVEAVLLTGGASRRMGVDKASLVVDGVPLGQRIAAGLKQAGYPVSVLGAEPIEGFPFQRDLQARQGPLAALRHYPPNHGWVFVTACDLPLFDAGVVAVLRARIGESDAAVPALEGRLQPLCALYTSSALARLSAPDLAEARSMMAFLDTLSIVELPETDFPPNSLRSANTFQELERLLGDGRGLNHR